jgi:AcrR family transcriptional regulator
MPATRPRLSAEDWIKAGFRALSTTGPETLKAEALARTLGATKGSFYWHFKDVPDFKARMLGHWHAKAFAAITRSTDAGGDPTERLYRLAELAAAEPEDYGGAAVEPAIRTWGASDPLVAAAVAEVDAKRLAYLAGLLAELGLTNPDFARIVYGAYVGMSTLSAADGADNAGAMSTLMAAILALQEA